MTKTDHVDFEEQELRQAIERDVAAAGLWDTCAECASRPRRSLPSLTRGSWRAATGRSGP